MGAALCCRYILSSAKLFSLLSWYNKLNLSVCPSGWHVAHTYPSCLCPQLHVPLSFLVFACRVSSLCLGSFNFAAFANVARTRKSGGQNNICDYSRARVLVVLYEFGKTRARFKKHAFVYSGDLWCFVSSLFRGYRSRQPSSRTFVVIHWSHFWYISSILSVARLLARLYLFILLSSLIQISACATSLFSFILLYENISFSFYST